MAMLLFSRGDPAWRKTCK